MTHPARSLLVSALLSVTFSGLAGAQDAGQHAGIGQSAWERDAKSAARLIASGPAAKGPAAKGPAAMGANAGVEIKLDPRTITYWRNPGDAGVPPRFDFSGSTNMASVEVLYPAPNRISEANGEAFGYRDNVMFPVRAKAADPAKPATLVLKLDYAACERICIPARAQLSLTLPATAIAAQQARIAAAEASVPRQITRAQALERVSLTREKAALRIIARDPAAMTDIFAEVPEEYFAESKKQPDGSVLVTLVQHPKDAKLPFGPLRLTMTGREPVEFAVPLDEIQTAN